MSVSLARQERGCLNGRCQRRFMMAFIAINVTVLLVILRDTSKFQSIIQHTHHNDTPEESLLNLPPLCNNVLDAMKNGTWKRKFKLTQKVIQVRNAQEVFLRIHRGLPINLTRSDLRCGFKYPIPAPKYGPSLPAMCNRESRNYCCNADGWCTSGHSNCSCAECTNFQKILNAELYDWIPHNCQIRKYTNGEACALVEDRLTNLVLIGDSIMRHFYSALMLIFTDDFQKGALLENHKRAEQCTGERQFVDSGKTSCHEIIARKSEDKKHKFCNGTSKFSMFFNSTYKLAFKHWAFEIVKTRINRTNSLIVIGLGIHDNFPAERVQAELINPIAKLIGGHKWPRLLWVTGQAIGYIKPAAYRGSQSNQKIFEYNKLMLEKLKMKGIEVFDIFPMSKEVYSYDGTHYGYGMNTIKAQYLLNYIHQTFQPKTKSSKVK